MQTIDGLERNRFDRLFGWFGAADTVIMGTGLVGKGIYDATAPLFPPDQSGLTWHFAAAAIPAATVSLVEARVAYAIFSWGAAAARREFAGQHRAVVAFATGLRNRVFAASLTPAVAPIVDLSRRLG